jgi:hypothetical protein
VITEDLSTSGAELQGAESVVVQRLRSIVVIPLYALRRANSSETVIFQRAITLPRCRWRLLRCVSDRRRAHGSSDCGCLRLGTGRCASGLDAARRVVRDDDGCRDCARCCWGSRALRWIICKKLLSIRWSALQETRASQTIGRCSSCAIALLQGATQ